MKKWLNILKETYNEWSDDKCLQIGAALSFYTLSSLVPLLLVITSILTYAAFFTDVGQNTTNQIIGYIGENVGQETATALSDAIKGRQQSDEVATGSLIGTIVGFLSLLFTASGVFSQLDTAFDDMWDIPKEQRPQGILGTVRSKFFAFGLILAVAFILLASTILTTTLNSILTRLNLGPEWFYFLVNLAVSFAIITFIFMLLFKYLPSTTVEWRDVVVGGALTAVLWIGGQQLLSFYFSRSSFSSYGVVGGVLAFLVYVYYSSQIVFFGGEFTQVYARSHGSQAQPEGQAAGTAPDGTTQPSAVERALAEARKRELLRKEQELSQAQRRTRSTAASSGAVGLLVGAVLGGVALVAGIARTVGRLRGGSA